MTSVVLPAFIHTLPTLCLLSFHPILLWHQGPPTSKAQRTEFASCVCHTSELDKQTDGDCSWQKGVKEKHQFLLFCTETASQNSQKSAPLSCTTNLPPWGSQLDSDKQSRGSFCTRSPLHTLKIHWSRRHVAAVPVGRAKKTAQAGSSMSYPEGEFSSHTNPCCWASAEQLLHPHCGCRMESMQKWMQLAQHTWSAVPKPTRSSPCSSKEAKSGIHLANLKPAQNNPCGQHSNTLSISSHLNICSPRALTMLLNAPTAEMRV